ncbi:energy transducer TonB [Pseudomethylobacillus aquaticus]|uniref:Energy transducer TonB n=1 Tax=Pseudomethylobacillus aquaticus TaxID=2676064 RepID=A0A3N0V3M2_9PROT|nr:TonB family protein [Pseudomethylobacillus aquaticus]ROH87305.1 energy transducer TonB [Pseudomethylobacillus aquaticus]
MLQRWRDPLTAMLAVSGLIHLVLIVNLHFQPPEPHILKHNTPPMDVVLVNAKSQTPPDDPKALAQANLDAGGNTAKVVRSQSPLPVEARATSSKAPKPQPVPDIAEQEVEQKQARVAELEKQAQELLSRSQAEPVLPVPEPARSGTADQPRKPLSGVDLAASSMEIARLQTQISKQQQAYEQRPRQKFIGARTQESRFAAYVEAWRQKVQRIGNLNYPAEAREKKLYGRLRMTVSIRQDGSLERIEINQSSGHAVLDDAARRIVELGAPYAPLPDDIRVDTDILSIERTWTFTRQDSLNSD